MLYHFISVLKNFHLTRIWWVEPEVWKLGPSEKIDPTIFYSIKSPMVCQALVLLKMSTEQPEPSLGSDSLLHFSVQLYIESKFTIYKLENKIWNTSQSQMVLSWYSIPIDLSLTRFCCISPPPNRYCENQVILQCT